MILSYKFKKPFVFEGQEYKQIEVDTDKITAGMLEAVDLLIAEVPKNPSYVPNPLSNMVQIRLLAMLMQKPIEFVKAMPANAFIYFSTQISNFLIVPDSELMEEGT